MLTLPSSVRVFLALDPVSMHLSFDRLAGLVRGLGLDPTTGHLFVFINRPKTHMKVLFFVSTQPRHLPQPRQPGDLADRGHRCPPLPPAACPAT